MGQVGTHKAEVVCGRGVGGLPVVGRRSEMLVRGEDLVVIGEVMGGVSGWGSITFWGVSELFLPPSAWCLLLSLSFDLAEMLVPQAVEWHPNSLCPSITTMGGLVKGPFEDHM